MSNHLISSILLITALVGCVTPSKDDTPGQSDSAQGDEGGDGGTVGDSGDEGGGDEGGGDNGGGDNGGGDSGGGDSGGEGGQDADGDGYTTDDCDDTNPEIHPDADERCDGVDNNCDDNIDGDALDAGTWYPDDDGDGFGDADRAVQSCVPADGYVADALDCDDADAEVHPDASERCDGLDNNCDGDTDEDSAIDAATWYRDADGDGYGDPLSATLACAAPDAAVADNTDCDDTNPGAYPDATEVCDGADNNCDGDADEPSAVDAVTWYRDTDGDGYGDPADATVACDAPDHTVLDDSDCDDTNPDTYLGADETCDGEDDDCDGDTDEDSAVDAPTWYRDTDGDSYGDLADATVACDAPDHTVLDDQDCDDTNPDTYPGADETCDGEDDDCDGDTDEDSAIDAPIWYRDTDGDGYGDGDRAAPACSAPEDTVADATDCDDTNPDTYPGAAERCDGEDDNCDGDTDEDSAVDAPTWYRDTDGDGYGDADRSMAACEAPDATVADPTDCDDADPDTHPDADETCDGEDDDCDRKIDEEDAIDQPSWYADSDGDGYGDLAAETVTCDAPSGSVGNAEDCDDASDLVNPDASEVCEDGVDNDCDGSSGACGLSGSATASASADAILTGEKSNDRAGYSVSNDGDVNGDGTPDLLIGASYSDKGASSGGAAYLVLGPVSGTTGLASAAAVLTAEKSLDGAGKALAIARDLDMDGYDDLLVGADGNDPGTVSSAGSAYLVYGPMSGTLGLASSDAIFTGDTSFDAVGMSVAGLGDVTGDGQGDLGVGGDGLDLTAGGAGAVGLWFEAPTGSARLKDADLVVSGDDSNDALGQLTRAGDLDSDGVDDLLVGAESADVGTKTSGAAYAFLGPVGVGSAVASDADTTFVGVTTSDSAGHSLAGADDIDGDGHVDLVIGAYGDDTTATSSGMVYVMAGPLGSGNISVSTAVATIAGDAKSDSAGFAVGAGGDTDGDGHADVLVGAYGSDKGTTDGGAVALFLGPLSGALKVSNGDALYTGGTKDDQVGTALAPIIDLNLDGYGDLLMGAYGADTTATGAGAAYVIYGQGL